MARVKQGHSLISGTASFLFSREIGGRPDFGTVKHPLVLYHSILSLRQMALLVIAHSTLYFWVSTAPVALSKPLDATIFRSRAPQTRAFAFASLSTCGPV